MRQLLAVCGCLTLLGCWGCSMCASPYDCQYAAYGGLRERTDMVHGRVGSVFDPAPEINHAAATRQSPQPTPADEPDGVLGPADGPDGAPGPADDVRGDTDTHPPDELPSPADAVPPIRPPGTPDSDLPNLPEGTIELPELNGSEIPGADGNRNGLPESLPDAAQDGRPVNSLPDIEVGSARRTTQNGFFPQAR